MIDLHSHVLPGLDDGARTMEEALDLARRAAAEGVEAIAATPHVRIDYPTTPDQMERAVHALRDQLVLNEVPLRILPGGEVSLELLWELPHDDLVRFTLAQTGRYLLLEFPYRGWPLGLEPAVKTLLARDITPLLAHPERNPEVQDRPDRLVDVVRAGALVQVTAGSLVGRLDGSSRRTAEKLLGLGVVHVLASDAHGPHIREGGIAAAAEAVGDAQLAHYLTHDAPAAIVAGEPVPPVPARPKPSRGRSAGIFG